VAGHVHDLGQWVLAGYGPMRYLLSRRIPDLRRILLIESGPRPVIERVIPFFRDSFAPGVPLDVLTCYSGDPEGLPPGSETFRVGPGESRKKLLKTLKIRRHSHVGIICTGSSVLSKWKWAAATVLPAKVFVINQNGDFFWLDWGHRRTLWQLWRSRSGPAHPPGPDLVLRVLAAPFTLLYLLLYAGFIHLRRKVSG
jgi:hypothetical protein